MKVFNITTLLILLVLPQFSHATIIDFNDRSTSIASLTTQYADASWGNGWKTKRWDGDICARGVDGSIINFTNGAHLNKMSVKVRNSKNQAQGLLIVLFSSDGDFISSTPVDNLSTTWTEVYFEGKQVHYISFLAVKGAKNSRFFINDLEY